MAVFVYGYLARDGDLSYGRLARIPEMLVFEWWTLIPPLVILVLTRFGIPVSTTFLILIVFNPRGLESMFVKSMIGYAMAIAVGYLVYRLVTRGLERRFIETSRDPPAAWWTVLQWGSTGFLWSMWLIQDLANIVAHLPRSVGPGLLIAVLAVMLALLAWIFYRRGGEIQHIVTTKINTRDVRSATVIDFIYGSILLFFKEWSDVPMNTTWVFLGLLAGREFAIGMDTWLRTNRETAMIVVKDAFKAAIGLGISIAMALGLR